MQHAQFGIPCRGKPFTIKKGNVEYKAQEIKVQYFTSPSLKQNNTQLQAPEEFISNEDAHQPKHTNQSCQLLTQYNDFLIDSDQDLLSIIKKNILTDSTYLKGAWDKLIPYLNQFLQSSLLGASKDGLSVEDNGGDSKYGHNFFPTYYMSRVFLEYVNNLVDGHGNFIEMAGGIGVDSLPNLIATVDAGHNFYFNELSKKQIDVFQTKFKAALPKNLQNNVKTISGDCCNIPSTHNELIGNCSGISAKNLLHFFSPRQMDRWIDAVQELLKSGAWLFISVNSIPSEEVMSAINSNIKNGIKYPEYVSITYNDDFTAVKKIDNGFIADYDTTTSVKDVEEGWKTISTCFTTEILKSKFDNKGFNLIDVFYTDQNGYKENKANPCGKTNIILAKK